MQLHVGQHWPRLLAARVPGRRLVGRAAHRDLGPRGAHAPLAVCSDMGYCDRALGACVCRDGFEGAACERIACPTDDLLVTCSGHGRCMTLREAGAPSNWDGRALTRPHATYENNWDADVTGCVCDAGFHGHNCSLRTCPTGDDPRSKGQRNSVAHLACRADAGAFELTLRGHTTKPIRHDAHYGDPEAALNALRRRPGRRAWPGNGSATVCGAGFEESARDAAHAAGRAIKAAHRVHAGVWRALPAMRARRASRRSRATARAATRRSRWSRTSRCGARAATRAAARSTSCTTARRAGGSRGRERERGAPGARRHRRARRRGVRLWADRDRGQVVGRADRRRVQGGGRGEHDDRAARAVRQRVPHHAAERGVRGRRRRVRRARVARQLAAAQHVARRAARHEGGAAVLAPRRVRRGARPVPLLQARLADLQVRVHLVRRLRPSGRARRLRPREAARAPCPSVLDETTQKNVMCNGAGRCENATMACRCEGQASTARARRSAARPAPRGATRECRAPRAEHLGI